MTIRGSNVSAIKTELVTRLGGRAGLSGVQVLYQRPVEEIETSSIWFGRADIDIESIAMKPSSGQVELREDVSIEIAVQALAAETQTAADTTAVAMLGEVFEELATYPTLEGNVVGLKHIYPDQADMEVGLLGNSSLYACRFDVTLHATSLIKETTA